MITIYAVALCIAVGSGSQCQIIQETDPWSGRPITDKATCEKTISFLTKPAPGNPPPAPNVTYTCVEREQPTWQPAR